MKYYLIGIKGAGMSALALILTDLGSKVVGYDDAERHIFTEDELNKRNIEIYFDNSFVLSDEIIVIKSTAIKDDHPEIIKAKKSNCKIYEYHQMLGKLTKQFDTITISGCHGKTTTTSMLSHVLNNIRGCNFLIGDGTGYSNKKNNLFVIEACEYKRHFLEYSPKYAIITNIDFDHVDYFKDINDVINAYQEYINKVNKMIIACGDDDLVRTLHSNKIKYYGIQKNNDIVACNVDYHIDGTSFDVIIDGKGYGHYNLPLYGHHMLLNALSVIGICYYENINSEDVKKYLSTFKGAKRRFSEKIIGDIITIDDYAHHPTEVAVTIKSARHKYPNKNIIAIYQPHTYSRTKAFTNELVAALNLADYAYVMDIYEAREKADDYVGINSYNIINNLDNGSHISMTESCKLLKHKNSVLIFMSANDIYELQESFELSLIRDNLKNIEHVTYKNNSLEFLID